MSEEYAMTLRFEAEQIEPFDEAVNLVCVGYPRVVQAALDGLREVSIMIKRIFHSIFDCRAEASWRR